MSYKAMFPIFDHYPELSYLDNAATSQKPRQVIERLNRYYASENGSPHRGAHDLSVKSTVIYDESRQIVADFIGAGRKEEIIFTRNATESLNMIAYSLVAEKVSPGQNIVLSITNHHSNILPFQRLIKKGVEVRYLYCDEEGRIPSSELDKIDPQTYLVSVPYISNGLGVKHTLDKIFDRATAVGAFKLLDAAQAVGHEPFTIQDIQPDLMVFSGHKMFAPQGIGVLYGRYDILETFEPFLSGGDMIEYVEEQTSTFADLPERLEAGTQYVAGVLGLAEAIRFIKSIGLDKIHTHEADLTAYAYEKLSETQGVTLYGPKDLTHRGALITFNIDGVHPHDVASIMDSEGVAIRAGHHCCQPLMKYMKTASTCRVSFSIFNTKADVDALIKGIQAVKKVFYE